MTKHEAAIIELYTNTCMLKGDDRKYIYEYAEKLTGRPVFTHELPYIADEFNDKIRDDFIEICKNTTDTDDKHGKWLICSDGYYPYCSECGNEPTRGEMTKYCAECGARMDKE